MIFTGEDTYQGQIFYSFEERKAEEAEADSAQVLQLKEQVKKAWEEKAEAEARASVKIEEISTEIVEKSSTIDVSL